MRTPSLFACALLVPSLLLAAGCGSSSGSAPTKVAPAIPPASVAPGQEATLLPLTLGTQWVYAFDQTTVTPGQPARTTSSELIWTITKSQKTPAGTRATVELRKGNEVMDRQEWLANEKGIFQVSASPKAIPYNPPQPIIPFPLKEGQETDWKGRGVMPIGGIGEIHSKTEVMGAQEVDTDSDRVSAIAVRSTSDFKVQGTPGQSNVVSWFKPGVGIVRYHAVTGVGQVGGESTLRLKTSTVK